MCVSNISFGDARIMYTGEDPDNGCDVGMKKMEYKTPTILG